MIGHLLRGSRYPAGIRPTPAFPAGPTPTPLTWRNATGAGALSRGELDTRRATTVTLPGPRSRPAVDLLTGTEQTRVRQGLGPVPKAPCQQSPAHRGFASWRYGCTATPVSRLMPSTLAATLERTHTQAHTSSVSPPRPAGRLVDPWGLSHLRAALGVDPSRHESGQGLGTTHRRP